MPRYNNGFINIKGKFDCIGDRDHSEYVKTTNNDEEKDLRWYLNTGGIRICPEGIEITVEPNTRQYRVLESVIKDKLVFNDLLVSVEIGEIGYSDTFTIEDSHQKIINFIKRMYLSKSPSSRF